MNGGKVKSEESKSLLRSLKKLANLFKEDSDDLLSLYTKLFIYSEVHSIVEKTIYSGSGAVWPFCQRKVGWSSKVNQRPNKEKQTPGVHQKSTGAWVPGYNNEGQMIHVFQIMHSKPMKEILKIFSYTKTRHGLKHYLKLGYWDMETRHTYLKRTWNPGPTSGR
jgi:hypothetical protein